ncbi:MAG: T9SS type A sorting domain-containing protein [Bacteroidales bacterium]|nr:T9SS type A sorting domain-containing protein [Bacteroidales bacterium]
MKKRLLFLMMVFAFMNFLSAQVIADFEDGTTGPLTLHVMGCGDYDNDLIHPVEETFMVVDNPDATGLNESTKVLKFVRRGTDNGGMPWGGFWANVDPNIDVTVNKYAHVLVWKPMVSPLRFKLEGSPTLETPSINTQPAASEWVDIVFDFSTLTGNYAVMSLMPDFTDPFVTAGDMDIYIDNIIFNDDPTPFGNPTTASVKFSVDMSYQTTLGNFDPAVDFVDVAGSFNGWDGVNSHLTMESDGIYSITVGGLEIGTLLEFKFRINGDWNNSEFPNGGPNRTYTVVDGTNEIMVWYNDEQPETGTMIADFEDGTTGPLTLHVMGCGEFDDETIHPVSETFMVIDNPDMSGLNTSAKVLKFIRRGTDNGGLPWGGFWANVDPAIDVTVNKYAHVLVWKSTISPVKFKLEGNPTLETPSMNTQPGTGHWVDMVFDYSTLTGSYGVMALMPDFTDPFETAEDVDIFIDNIYFSADPNPMGTAMVKLSVNMSYQTSLGNFDPAVDFVDVAGSFNGWDGVNSHLTMESDGIYSIAVANLEIGVAQEFKFRINGDWNTSEFPNGGPNRTYTAVEGINEVMVWYNDEQPSIAGMIADFEDGTTGPLTLHVMGCGDFDNPDLHPVDETFMVIDNPDASGINTSTKVLKFIRRGTDNGGLPWGGFWANCDPGVSTSENKYVHVMVWKPMVSPIKFKLEGNPTLETGSMYPQTETNMWQDIVFDFTTLDGNYPVLALMPDFVDPVTSAADVEIFIDNIQITNSSDPISGIFNNKADTQIEVYPNPFSNEITMHLTTDTKSVVISNMMGQTVYSQQDVSKGYLSIDASFLTKGMYFVTLTDNQNNRASAKLLKN